MLRNDDIEQIVKQDPQVDIATVLLELARWQNSLCGDLLDDTVAATIDSVVDIIIDNCNFNIKG